MRSRYLWCLVALMTISASLQQSVESCSTTDINNKKLFILQWLKGQNVVINESPVKPNSDACEGEFKNYGTCCEFNSVKNFNNKMNGNMVLKWKKYIGKLARIKNRFMNGLQKVAKMMNNKEIDARREKCKSDPKTKEKFANVDEMLPDKDSEVAAIQKVIGDFQEQLKMFKTQGKICFNAMRNIRANLMCMACSARNWIKDSSSTNSNILIDYTSCSGLVAKCFPIWRFNFQLTAIIQYAQLSIINKKGDKAGTKFKSDKAMSSSDLDKIKSVFSRCDLVNGATFNCTDDVMTRDYTQRLCEILFSMNKQNGYVEGDESIDQDVEDTDITDAETASEVIKRLLQTTVSDQSNYNVGVHVHTDSPSVFNLLNENTGLVPTESVETGYAGDSSSSTAFKLAVSLALSFASFLAVI